MNFLLSSLAYAAMDHNKILPYTFPRMGHPSIDTLTLFSASYPWLPKSMSIVIVTKISSIVLGELTTVEFIHLF